MFSLLCNDLAARPIEQVKNFARISADTTIPYGNYPAAGKYYEILPNSGHSTPIYYKDDFNGKVEELFTGVFHVNESFSRLQ